MSENVKSKKNRITIRTTESAIFLRSDGSGRQQRRQDDRPTILRGLVTLDLVKPTRITSIDVELQAKTLTSWSEGIGARRMDVSEEHKVFTATSVLFRAADQSMRRTASLGPGLSYYDDMALDDEEEEEQQRSSSRADHNVSALLQVPGTSRDSSVTRRNRHLSIDLTSLHRHASDGGSHSGHIPDPAWMSPPLTEAPTPSSASSERHVNPDTGTSLSPLRLVDSHARESPAQTLEDFRNALRADLTIDNSRRNSFTGLNPSSSSSARSFSLSRRPSIEDVPEDPLQGPPTPVRARSNPRVGDVGPGPSSTSPAMPESSSRQHTPSRSQSPPAYLDPNAKRSPSTDQRGRHSGRRSNRFSLTSMGSVLLDAVRSSPTRSTDRDYQRQRVERVSSRDESPDSASRGRGRAAERTNVQVHPPQITPQTATVVNRGRATGVGGFLADILKQDHTEGNHHDWKEFKKGTYTFAISFAIPADAPPTIDASSGSVAWMLKANAHRPGTFRARMFAERKVIVVTCPTEEDTEDTENVIVERQWDGQMQYLITISGRSFYIGGTVPMSFTLMPLDKMKVHRIVVYIEEKTEYLTNFKRVARTDPIIRIPLVNCRDDSKESPHILPLESDAPDALQNSPLYMLIGPDDDLSEVASSLMSPGPWSFNYEAKLPQSCKLVRFTNKNKRTNMTTTHTLKFVMRVERGDNTALDAKTGKKKLFDIVVQTPVQILSCRCNPEWTSLPHYSEALKGNILADLQCPCAMRNEDYNTRQPPSLERIPTDSSGASAVENSGVIPSHAASLRNINLDSVIDRNTEYEMLVSGRLSESGEMPPAYGTVV